MTNSYRLTLSCNDRAGIVARVSTALFEHGGNILDAAQFDDISTNRFFMRVEFDLDEKRDIEDFRAAFAALADDYGMEWTLRPCAERQRVLILVSKFDHCLADLLYRWRIGELAMEVAGIISNHPRETYRALDLDGIPFHHLPVTAANKAQQERRIREIAEESGADLVVLARYMQILTDGLCKQLDERVINIHHSMLPSFKGARPYERAHARGVKIIGATAHYVTADLDEGPIIEQEIMRVDHSMSAEEFVAHGREVECRALARAVRWHTENRIVVNGATTVILQ